MSKIDSKFFDQPDARRTLALKAENRQFWVSKEMLAIYSPVFDRMFYAEEYVDSKKNIIDLPGKKAEDIEELLLCLFPTPEMKPIDDQNVTLLLALSDEYLILDLQPRIESYLISKLGKLQESDEEMLNILCIASKYRMKLLLVPLVKRCAEEFEMEKLEDVFPDLKSDIIAWLLLYKAPKPDKQCPLVNTNEACSNGHSGQQVLKCKICQKLYCGTCNNISKSARKCPEVVKKFEDSVGLLLNRI